MNEDRYVIYPGTFDPFHNGHKHVVGQALNNIENITKFVVLLQQSTFKPTRMFTEEFSTLHIENSLAEYEGMIDIRSTDMDYFDEWLSMYLHCECNDDYDADIYLVIGDDALDNLHKWHNFESWKHGITFVVTQRAKSQDQIKLLEAKLDITCKIIPHDFISARRRISSTEIRDEVSALLNKHIHY